MRSRYIPRVRYTQKPYIFDYGKVYDDKGRELSRTENGVAAVGSSNLSLAGIEHNTELNVMVHGNDNHAALTDWFEELWSEAEEFDEALMEEMKQSWAVSLATPYDVYMKTLYTLVRDRLEDVAPKDLIVDNEISKQLADFQKVAVKHAIQNIRDYGGTFVADVVGLGKSFIGAAIVKHFEQSEKARPLIICPPPLIEMWERYNEIYHLNARVLSMGMLKQDDDNTFRTLLENYRYKDRDFILIDESHHLRNHGTQRYKVLETFLAAGKRCCLLTATPRNNSAWDIYHQLKLFHQDDLTDLPIDPPNLKEYFRGVEKGERNLQDLLSHVLIRRTRNQIIRFYGYDAETHQKVIESGNYRDYQTGKRKAYVLVGGQHRFFPKRELETIEYSIEDTYQGLYQQLRSRIGKPRKKQLRNLIKNELSYARYGLWNFVIKEKQNKEPYLTLQSAGSNLRGLIRVLLFKRFESSVCAFKATVQRLLIIHQNFLNALDAGIVPAGEEAQKLLSQENPEGEEIDLINILDKLHEASKKYNIEDFNAKKLKKHIEHDVQIFQEILDLVEPISPEQDTKLEKLKEWLDKPLLKGKKRLIFTQYEDTAKYLYKNLNPDNSIDDIDVIYSSSGKSKALLVAKFAPKANKDYKLKADELEINTLIATDVLAEGLNMQDGDLIINYDLHWNPVKLIQRFGRIDRIGSEKETIYGFNFLPELGIERNLGLQQKLRNRIQEIHDTIGEDAAILDRNEQLNEEAMYAIYGKQSESENVQLSLFDEAEELMELTDAEEILKQLKQDHPEEYDRITKLPNGIRSARYSTNSGTYVFCEASDPNRPDIRSYQKLYLIDKQGNFVTEDVSRILGSIRCEPTTPTAKLPQDYNAIVMKIKKQFAEEVKHRQAERDYSSNLTTAQKYIQKELRALFNLTEEETQKAQIDLLDRAFQNHLPKSTRTELNALKANRIKGQELFEHLKKIYNQYELHKKRDRQNAELKSQPIPMIICSEGLV